MAKQVRILTIENKAEYEETLTAKILSPVGEILVREGANGKQIASVVLEFVRKLEMIVNRDHSEGFIDYLPQDLTNLMLKRMLIGLAGNRKFKIISRERAREIMKEIR